MWLESQPTRESIQYVYLVDLMDIRAEALTCDDLRKIDVSRTGDRYLVRNEGSCNVVSTGYEPNLGEEGAMRMEVEMKERNPGHKCPETFLPQQCAWQTVGS